MVLSIISSVVAVINAFVYVIVAFAVDVVEQLDSSNDYVRKEMSLSICIIPYISRIQ